MPEEKQICTYEEFAKYCGCYYCTVIRRVTEAESAAASALLTATLDAAAKLASSREAAEIRRLRTADAKSALDARIEFEVSKAVEAALHKFGQAISYKDMTKFARSLLEQSLIAATDRRIEAQKKI